MFDISPGRDSIHLAVSSRVGRYLPSKRPSLICATEFSKHIITVPTTDFQNNNLFGVMKMFYSFGDGCATLNILKTMEFVCFNW